MPRFIGPVLLAAALSGFALGHDGPHGHHPDPVASAAAAPDLFVPAATIRGAASYRLVPDWGRADGHLGSTHGGIIVDGAGRVLVSTDTDAGILMFNGDGKRMGSLGTGLNGVHGLALRREGDAEFIYAAHLAGKRIVKLNTKGGVIWSLGLPAASERYLDNPAAFNPTAVAVAPDGSIFVADGYGRNWIHHFDRDLNHVRTFGGHGTEPGQFRTCHGLIIDERGAEPRLIVCDRENRRLQRFDLNGAFLDVPVTGLRRPCALAVHGDLMAVAELEGRVTLLDRDFQVVAHLGDNPDRGQWAKFNVPVERWSPGVFTAPHGCGFDADGNLYVQDWNATGRVTKFERIAP